MSNRQSIDETPVTFVILIAYVTMMFVSGGLNPTTESLVEHGARIGLLEQTGEPWRLLTHAFLHGGLLHIGFNGYFLFTLGPQLERALGSVKFTWLYAIAAVSGGVASSLWSEPVGVSVGGSGALFGMFGAMIALIARQGRTQLEFLRSDGARRILTFIALNFAIGILIPVIDNAAHFGGLVGGFVFVYCFLDQGRVEPDRVSRWIRAGWITLFLGLITYCAFPVLRWDYQYRMSFQATTEERRAEHRAAISTLWQTPFEHADFEVRRAFEGSKQKFRRELIQRWRSGQ